MALKKWRKLDSRILFRNNWWSYKRDSFEIPGGYTGEYHYVATPGSIMIVPRFNNGFLLVRQYRYLNERTSVEFPAGGIKPGVDAIESASRELEEETGYKYEALERIGAFNPFNGVTDEICQVFVASGLHPGTPNPDPTEEFELCPMSAEEIDRAIRNGEIWDGMTMAAWALFVSTGAAR